MRCFKSTTEEVSRNNLLKIIQSCLFFRRTNCDVGCVLFIVLVLNKCKPNLREIFMARSYPHSYSSLSLGKYHCYTATSKCHWVHSYSFSKFLLCVSTIASLSKFPYFVFCWVSPGFFGCKCASPRGSLGIMYHADCTRGGICPCRQCRGQCKIFASGVNFSIFTHFLCFFPTKTVEIRWNWRCNF